MLEIILIIIGFIFLIKGSDFLIDGAENIARKLKISEFVIGLTLVAIGTSLPELIVSIESVTKGHDNLLIGNILGSCIYNVLLILGIIIVIKPIKVENKPSGNILLLIISTLIVGIFANYKQQISKTEGILLLLIFIIFLLSAFSKKQKTKINLKGKSILKSMILIILGIILLKFGGEFVVDNSIKLAKKLNISESIIGLSVIALGTSLPELVTSIVAIKKETEDIAIGNIIGSNIFNLLLVLGTTSLIHPIKFANSYNGQLIFLIIISIVLYIFNLFNNKQEAGKLEGIILLITFILYNAKFVIV
ncbi:MAG: calcium/sodium antiporter [Clostridia bacterium]